MHLAPGDIVEIETRAGPSYVQVTHRHVSYPEVVRALDWRGGDAPRPDELGRTMTRFTAMIPLGAAMERGTIRGRKIGTAALPAQERDFPVFKTPILNKQDGLREEVAYWWFWDGDGLSYAEEPAGDIERIPTREVLSAEQFLERLAS